MKHFTSHPPSHENTSGYYRVSAFFLSKVMIDLIALRFIPNTVFTIITYFMLGESCQLLPGSGAPATAA